MPRVMRGAPTIGHDMVTRLHAAAVQYRSSKQTSEQFQEGKKPHGDSRIKKPVIFHHP